LSWMGGARPSDYLACARATFGVWGEQLSPEVAAGLTQLQAAVAEQQASMSAAFAELSERLARTAAVARYVRAACASNNNSGPSAAAAGGGDKSNNNNGGSGSGFGLERASSETPRSGFASAEGTEDAATATTPEADAAARGTTFPADNDAFPSSSSSGLPPPPTSHLVGLSPTPPPPPPSPHFVPPRASNRRQLDPPSPAASGIVDDMAALLRHADELRALVAARVSEPQGLLTPRQQALFWLCVQDLVDLDARPTPKARPRKGLSVRRPPEARGRLQD